RWRKGPKWPPSCAGERPCGGLAEDPEARLRATPAWGAVSALLVEGRIRWPRMPDDGRSALERPYPAVMADDQDGNAAAVGFPQRVAGAGCSGGREREPDHEIGVSVEHLAVPARPGRAAVAAPARRIGRHAPAELAHDLDREAIG